MFMITQFVVLVALKKIKCYPLINSFNVLIIILKFSIKKLPSIVHIGPILHLFSA